MPLHALVDIRIDPGLEGAVRLGVIAAEGVSVTDTPESHRRMLDELAADYERRYAGTSPGQIEVCRQVRKLFHATGLDPTRYRPSSEALFRRAAKGKGLYFINTAVDLINYYSLKLLVPMGLYDFDRVAGPIEFRVGREGETYEGIGRGELNLYHFPVLVDREGPFGSPISDSVRTGVRPETRRLLWVVIAPPSMEIPMDELAGAVEEWTGGRVAGRKLQGAGA